MPTDDQITAIKAVENDPVRFTIHVGRRRVATLMLDQIDALGLAVGVAWDPVLAQRIGEAALTAKCRRDALRMVNRRALSSVELTQKLLRKEHAAEIVHAVVATLVAKKFLNDEAFGRAVLEGQLRKPSGKRLLRHKLMQKRLPGSMVNRLVDQADASRDAVADAREFAQKKLRATSMKKLDPVARKRRIWSALARRGFEPPTIIAALDQLPELRGDASDSDY
jgi:regulatory protein